ncbi:protein translocase SEC61 complex subunit gamma [Candidatus Woesearchaeota archaeon]|nr:protein translocase SEC61 complex subunit gamma [Candidatus Woesearchaeota archaeon]
MDEHNTSMFTRIKSFAKECRRVLKVTKKPSKEEFKTIVKVSGLGIMIIGLVGFIINMGKQLLF